MRAGASERTEMVSQVLFGEFARSLGQEGNWIQVQTLHDDYTGWVVAKSLTAVDGPILDLSRTWGGAYLHPDGGSQVLPFGAWIGNNGEFSLHGKTWRSQEVNTVIQESPFHYAKKYLHAPYLWGGRTNWGIDCSGLVQMSFAFAGISLPRDASQQVQMGEEVAFSQKKENDLAFFASTPEGKVSHVGIVGAENTLIHASVRVRIDSFTEKGILVPETGSSSHYLLNIRRII